MMGKVEGQRSLKLDALGMTIVIVTLLLLRVGGSERPNYSSSPSMSLQQD
jgi:hypothetical protein